MMVCTAAAMLPKQAGGTFRKHGTKPFSQPDAPNCINEQRLQMCDCKGRVLRERACFARKGGFSYINDTERKEDLNSKCNRKQIFCELPISGGCDARRPERRPLRRGPHNGR